jgi:acyl-CoA synthetase (NDP forming)
VQAKSDFGRLFRPRAVAIVGASANPARIGGQPLHSLTQFGYAGGVYPVNPKYSELNGVICYPSLAAVPRPCDVAIIALPAALVAGAVAECGTADIPFAIVFSAGFREVGANGAALQDELVAAARKSGVRVIGPNCQGVLNLLTRSYCGFGSLFQKPKLNGGPVSMITQSGGFGTSVVKLAQSTGLGFNYVVSTGNEADVDALELIEFFLEQDDVEVVTTYLEGIKDGRRLLALGERALEIGKPVLVWKVGNSDSGRRAAVSHTANLTSGAELYRAVFRQGGFIEVRDVDDLMDCAHAFLSRRLPRGPNVAVVTNSGGAGVLLADRCEERGLHLPELGEATRNELRPLIPEYGALANPVDVTAQVSSDPLRINRVMTVLLEDPGIDQIILSRGSVVGKRGLQWALEFVKVMENTNKPVLVHMSPDQAEETVQVLEREHIPWYTTPGRAVTGTAALYDFSVKQQHHAAREARVLPRQAIDWPKTACTLGEYPGE